MATERCECGCARTKHVEVPGCTACPCTGYVRAAEMPCEACEWPSDLEARRDIWRELLDLRRDAARYRATLERIRRAPCPECPASPCECCLWHEGVVAETLDALPTSGSPFTSATTPKEKS